MSCQCLKRCCYCWKNASLLFTRVSFSVLDPRAPCDAALLINTGPDGSIPGGRSSAEASCSQWRAVGRGAVPRHAPRSPAQGAALRLPRSWRELFRRSWIFLTGSRRSSICRFWMPGSDNRRTTATGSMSRRCWPTPRSKATKSASTTSATRSFYSYRDCVVDYYDKTYDLSKIKTVDFLVIPFADNRAIAHTLLSFGFEGGDYVGVSVEVRLEKGESYSTAAGLLGQFELMYVVADEHDLLPVRPEFRHVDVLLYRTTATPAQARALFVDVMKRVNQLARPSGVLRHAAQQLHDEHRAAHQYAGPGPDAVRLPRAPARLCR